MEISLIKRSELEEIIYDNTRLDVQHMTRLVLLRYVRFVTTIKDMIGLHMGHQVYRARHTHEEQTEGLIDIYYGS